VVLTGLLITGLALLLYQLYSTALIVGFGQALAGAVWPKKRRLYGRRRGI
jgi:hypothetical protein